MQLFSYFIVNQKYYLCVVKTIKVVTYDIISQYSIHKITFLNVMFLARLIIKP